jgi:hypothetical protein
MQTKFGNHMLEVLPLAGTTPSSYPRHINPSSWSWGSMTLTNTVGERDLRPQRAFYVKGNQKEE